MHFSFFQENLTIWGVCHHFSDISKWLSFINSTTKPWVLFAPLDRSSGKAATGCLAPHIGMTQPNSTHYLAEHICLWPTPALITSTGWWPISHSDWIPRHQLWDQVPHPFQTTMSKPLLPGNLLMVIIVLILLQPLHRSCDGIGPSTEDLHGANQLLSFSGEKQTCQLTSCGQVWNLFTS